MLRALRCSVPTESLSHHHSGRGLSGGVEALEQDECVENRTGEYIHRDERRYVLADDGGDRHANYLKHQAIQQR